MLHKLHKICISFSGIFSPCKFTETKWIRFPFNLGNGSRSIYHLHPSELETWLHLYWAVLGLPGHPWAPGCPQNEKKQCRRAQRNVPLSFPCTRASDGGDMKWSNVVAKKISAENTVIIKIIIGFYSQTTNCVGCSFLPPKFFVFLPSAVYRWMLCYKKPREEGNLQRLVH